LKTERGFHNKIERAKENAEDVKKTIDPQFEGEEQS
jgi:hypothetical protein